MTTTRIIDEVMIAVNQDAGVAAALATCNTARAECAKLTALHASYVEAFGAPSAELAAELAAAETACYAAHAAWWTLFQTTNATLATAASGLPFLDPSGTPVANP
jgi:hypothetical protein